MGAVKSVYRYITHSIHLDPHAERDLEDLECTACDWTAGGGGTGLTFAQIQDAAMRHTGATQHSGFRQITTNYWRVVRHDMDTARQLSVPVVLTPMPPHRDGPPLRDDVPPARSSPEAPPTGSNASAADMLAAPPRPS